MRAALIIVLSLSALAYAGPAFNTNNNQIETNPKAQYQQQQQQYMTTGDLKQTQATESLKQWCFSSQMSQPELTQSFKKLVSIVKSSPEDQSTEMAVMSERICQNAQSSQYKQQSTTGPDAQAHELVKDVYMDALIACGSHDCMQQLVKIVNSNQVDAIRASYYMTRVAVTEKDSIKDDQEVEQFARQFIQSVHQQQGQGSEAVERQKLFATTSLLAKSLMNKEEQRKQPSEQLKQTAQQVAKTIIDRYIKSVSPQESQQYQQQSSKQQSPQVAKKIAKRNAALKALANIPGWILSENQSVEESLVELALNKEEQSTARQSAIECLEQNDNVAQQLKQITFDQEEPIEVRIAAYRALMTSAYAATGKKNEQAKHQQAAEIVDQVVRHCQESRNQQQDDQFVLYVISHLDNLRTSQQPEHEAIKQTLAKNKQHYMQIQLLNKKFKQQLSDVRKSSRNYKLEQDFNQIESGLVIEGDIIYESKQHKQQQQQWNTPSVLPKLVRVNMSMPVMGETVNVVEITLRQDQMDEEILGALKLASNTKFNSESMSKVVDSFKSSVEQQQQRHQSSPSNGDEQSAEADLSIKVDGCTIVYLSVDDFKYATTSQQHNKRNTRSTKSIVDEIVGHLKRNPVNFNRGFNFNIDQRIAKVLDVEANIIAGLRFESRAQGDARDFEIVTKFEPRFGFEAIVGPAKMSSKKLLQRLSTKTALGLRLRYKSDELVDVQVDLPMNTMELFTLETQMVEKSHTGGYNYSPESVYGQNDIYSQDEQQYSAYNKYDDQEDQEDQDEEDQYDQEQSAGRFAKGIRKMKRSVFSSQKKSTTKSILKFIQGKQSTFVESYETPEEIARATGLRNKLRIVASPKDMSFLIQAISQKYEPNMRGYRVQVSKIQSSGKSEQLVAIVSTPGSAINRNMQIRLTREQSNQRTVIKSEIQSPKMTASAQCELIHDGRQYAIKTDVSGSIQKSHQLSSGKQAQFRHQVEFGLQRGSQSQPGRVASTYKPYVSIDSSELKRPIQMQGVVSYQQSPKTVITYELKSGSQWSSSSSSSSADYVQGKIILDDRSKSTKVGQSYSRQQRSMQSPVEQLLQKDLTVTSEFNGQIEEHAFKVHQMIDWEPSKLAIQADYTGSYKNLRKQAEESQVSANLKLDQDQQMFTIQRKSPQQERKDFRFTLASDCRSASGHQMLAELRYNGKRQSNLQSIVAYKHKVDYQQKSPRQAEVSYTVELVDSERQMNEKFTGRTQVTYERKMKSIQSEMSTRGKSAKIDFEINQATKQHQLELSYQGERVQHRSSIRADQRQVSVQSRTDKDGQMYAKLNLEVAKEQGEAKLVVEMPAKKTHLAANLKLNSEQQMFTIQRKSPQQENKEFRLTLASDCRSPSGHQMLAELRYNGKRQSNLQSIMAYKHKVDYQQKSPKQTELGFTVELVDSERQMNEKFTGRTQVTYERKMKSIKSEMSSRNKSAKVDLEFVSLEEHKLELSFQSERVQHKTQVRADQRQCSAESRTDKDGQMVAKVVVEIEKEEGEGKLIVEMPAENTHVVVDLKLTPGKLSSIAVQTPRFASKGEFSFEQMSRFASANGNAKWNKQPYAGISQFRVKSDLKDTLNKEAYWLESAWNSGADAKSYLRLDSPVYRGDLEYEPREQKTKFGLFARSKRSINSYEKLYSNEDNSLLEQALEQAKLSLGNNKLWMIRSIISSPSAVEQLKQKAHQALFEYADRRQSQKHQLEYQPEEQRVNFNFQRQPNEEFASTYGYQSWQPMRLSGDLSSRRPVSQVSMQSEYLDFDLDTKPFGGEERYAKFSALSRHPRSPFKKHESEIRYKKQHGYEAYMKHQDSDDRHHSWQMEADESPKKWAKMSYDSDKYGKAEYEHQNQYQNQNQNKVYFKIDGKRTKGLVTIDLAEQSAQWNLDVDNKRTIQHETRVVRQPSGDFFSLDSTTSYKSKPLAKVSAKVSSMILDEPKHLLANTRYSTATANWPAGHQQNEHISTFQATIYQPKPMQVNGQFDCTKKLANISMKDL